MEKQEISENRRDFLTKVVPLAALFCFGCKRAAVQKVTAESSSISPEGSGSVLRRNIQFLLWNVHSIITVS